MVNDLIILLEDLKSKHSTSYSLWKSFDIESEAAAVYATEGRAFEYAYKKLAKILSDHATGAGTGEKDEITKINNS